MFLFVGKNSSCEVTLSTPYLQGMRTAHKRCPRQSRTRRKQMIHGIRFWQKISSGGQENRDSERNTVLSLALTCTTSRSLSTCHGLYEVKQLLKHQTRQALIESNFPSMSTSGNRARTSCGLPSTNHGQGGQTLLLLLPVARSILVPAPDLRSFGPTLPRAGQLVRSGPLATHCDEAPGQQRPCGTICLPLPSCDKMRKSRRD